MVCDPPPAGADVRNRGIGRGRMFMGGLLLFAAVVAWGTGFMMSPHAGETAAGMEHVRNTVVVFLRNSAIGTLILCALAGWLLFPARRPKWPARDYAIIGILGLLVASSIYNLVWIQTGLD
jgi:drug/metabolite transporter (DMT)-like permease